MVSAIVSRRTLQDPVRSVAHNQSLCAQTSHYYSTAHVALLLRAIRKRCKVKRRVDHVVDRDLAVYMKVGLNQGDRVIHHSSAQFGASFQKLQNVTAGNNSFDSLTRNHG
jgi:hypothetical protein